MPPRGGQQRQSKSIIERGGLRSLIPNQNSASSLSFRVWDMAKNWTVMIAPRVAAAAEDLPIFVGIELVFSEGIDLTPALIEEGQDLVRPSVSVDGASIRIDCPLDYLRAFGRPDNIGDRWMVP